MLALASVARVPDYDAPAFPLPLFARRFFSLSGVVPLGVFLVLHAVTNFRVVRGEPAFLATVRLYERIPALPLVEAVFVFAPLVFHATLGLWAVAARRPLHETSPYPGGVRVAMRATGVLLGVFLAMHLSELRFRVPGVRPSGGELLTVLASDLSATSHGVPWRGIAYLVGTGCATFHLSVGLWGFFATTNAGSRARERAWAAYCLAALGGVLWLTFANVVVLHATGARLFGAPEPWTSPAETIEREPCPAASVGP